MAVAILTISAGAAGVGAGVAGAVVSGGPPAPSTIAGPQAVASSGQIDSLVVTPETVLAGSEVVITFQFSGGSAQTQFGVVITDLNDEFNPFSCDQTLISGTSADGTDQDVCPVPTGAYIGNYTAQGVIYSSGPPPSVVFGPQAAFAVVSSQAITITTKSLPNGVVWNTTNKLRYSASLSAVGGNAPYRWSLASGSGPLPPGLKLRRSTGVIWGKATTAGSYLFTVQVVDSKTSTAPHTRNMAALTLSIAIS